MKLLIITQKVNENDQLLGFFVEWLKRFAGKFDKLTVLCLEKGDYVLPPNVEIISLGKERGAGKFKQLFTFFILLFLLQKRYNAVFVHMNPIWVVLGGLFWRIMGKRIFFWYTSGGVTLKLKLAEKFANIIFTASKESFRLPSKKLIVTGHGIDTGVFKPDTNPNFPISNSKLKILSVGRISPVKNYGMLIDAAKRLKDRGIDFTVTMIGEAALNSDISYLTSLRFKVKSLNLEENFNFIGKVNHKDLPRYYQMHDIFVHLSKTGSLDKTLLEAMACGMIILSSNDSARAFLSDDFLFNEDNSNELADKIRTVVKKTPVLALREYIVKNHNLDNLINKISTIINGA